MKLEPLPDEVVNDLLVAPFDDYPVPEQFGPLRHFDKEMRCAKRRCGSSTFYKIHGMPRCMTHALEELNSMLVERGVNQ
jgi:hypothetical protein